MTYRLGNKTGKQVPFYFNGKELKGFENEPIAAAIMANGIIDFRTCDVTGEGRGVYCGIGHCYECRVSVDRVPNVRTCLTPLKSGMNITSDSGEERGGKANER